MKLPEPIPTIRALVRWEQLRGKPFARVDLSDEADVDALLYACTLPVPGGPCPATLEAFRKALEQTRQRGPLAARLMRRLSVLSQFMPAPPEGGSKAGDEPESLGQVAAWLVAEGVDAGWVMGAMELCDLPLLCQALGRKGQGRMEEARYWTWLTVIPHLDTRGRDFGPHDLAPLPWDGEKAARAASVTPEEEKMFQALMGGGKPETKD